MISCGAFSKQCILKSRRHSGINTIIPQACLANRATSWRRISARPPSPCSGANRRIPGKTSSITSSTGMTPTPRRSTTAAYLYPNPTLWPASIRTRCTTCGWRRDRNAERAPPRRPSQSERSSTVREFGRGLVCKSRVIFGFWSIFVFATLAFAILHVVRYFWKLGDFCEGTTTPPRFRLPLTCVDSSRQARLADSRWDAISAFRSCRRRFRFVDFQQKEIVETRVGRHDSTAAIPNCELMLHCFKMRLNGTNVPEVCKFIKTIWINAVVDAWWMSVFSVNCICMQ